MVSYRSSLTQQTCKHLRVSIGAALYLLFSALLLCSHITYAAAEPTLSAEISPRHGEEDDLFIFTVTVKGTERVTGKPRLINELDFQAQLLGPQTNISIVNGVVDSRVSYVYQLTALRSGTLKTPRVELDYNGQVLTAPEVSVQIDQSGASKQGTPDEATKGTSTSDKLFIKQSVSPTKVYQGQQVINSLSLYTRVELAEFNLEDFSTDGFWQERFIDNDRSTTEIKGHEYVRLEHAKALYPLASGKLAIPARTARAKVVVRTQRQLPSIFEFGDSILHDFMQSVRHKEVKLSTEPLSIDVEPLPPAPPELADLVGNIPLVGETTLRASFSPDPISAGEVKTVAIELTTSGNVHPIKSIKLTAPEGVKVYEENPETTSVSTGAHVVMKRIFRFSLVPLRGGLVSIPPARIAYFDPARRGYLTASTTEITFPVNGEIIRGNSNSSARSAALTGGAGVTGSSSSAPEALPTLPPVPVAPDLEYREPSTLQRLTETVSVQLALLTTTATVAFSTLLLVFARRLATSTRAKVTPASVERAGTMKELDSVLRLFLSDKISAAKEDDTYELLRARVNSAAPSVEVAQATCSLIDQIEAARYGASADGDLLSEQKMRLRELMRQW